MLHYHTGINPFFFSFYLIKCSLSKELKKEKYLKIAKKTPKINYFSKLSLRIILDQLKIFKFNTVIH